MKTMQSTKKMTMKVMEGVCGCGGAVFQNGDLYVKERKEEFHQLIGRIIMLELQDAESKEAEIEMVIKMQVPKSE